MKLISLNTWGGRAGREKLLAFFSAHKDVDIFCLQEIWSAPYEHLEGHSAGGLSIDHSNIMVYGMQEISTLLENHTAFFKPHHLDHYGLMMLIKKDLDVISEGDVFVYKDRGHIPEGDVGFHARNVQFATIATKNGNRSILNFHGLWNGGGKGDSGDRLLQSDRIIQFMKTLSNPYVMSGDFNLLPDTQSIKKLEDFGLSNLIKEHNITSTRTSFYTKAEKFADYALTSKEIIIKDFKVLTDEVSDHSPLYLEFE
ncbi:endonuclease/exonuclease/phosphatase family protein [Candidatus Giovannonibacteria bacterium]|nr:endonuclease/exonuclease/phosphatase family protein [Candidatus Giovannonibacteria bacterium]